MIFIKNRDYFKENNLLYLSMKHNYGYPIKNIIKIENNKITYLNYNTELTIHEDWTENINIRPCPFCGSTEKGGRIDISSSSIISQKHKIHCWECGCEFTSYSDDTTSLDLIKKWNNRIGNI